MASSAPSWCTIESDPGVFSALVEEVGVQGVGFQEVYGVDEESFAQLAKSTSAVHGLIFLFKWTKEVETTDARAIDEEAASQMFFASQVISNACATQAIVSILLNRPGLSLGPTLSNLRSFAAAMSPQMRGLSISNSDALRTVHNSFRSHSSFEIEDDDQKGQEDAFHFVSYISFADKVYELDGLKKGPILLGRGGEANWLEVARPAIQKRIQDLQGGADSGNEIRFSLLALVADKRADLKRQILVQRHRMQRAKIKLVSFGTDEELDGELDDDEAPEETPSLEDLPDKQEELSNVVAAASALISDLQIAESSEAEQRERWRKENARRRHDFVPFVLCALRHLARRRELVPALTQGKRAHERRTAERKALEGAKKNSSSSSSS
eukprot:GHVT01063462.1.p1 GENE.GHVT01063462.1~~GHVT01063462.1.p1  ORF type:complete len:383 (+),score=116.58 GHVT01063462.1:188-1336(+)